MPQKKERLALHCREVFDSLTSSSRPDLGHDNNMQTNAMSFGLRSCTVVCVHFPSREQSPGVSPAALPLRGWGSAVRSVSTVQTARPRPAPARLMPSAQPSQMCCPFPFFSAHLESVSSENSPPTLPSPSVSASPLSEQPFSSRVSWYAAAFVKPLSERAWSSSLSRCGLLASEWGLLQVLQTQRSRASARGRSSAAGDRAAPR